MANTHDDGRLFGMVGDGTIWTEPALELRADTVGRPPVTCRHSVRQAHDVWDPCGCSYPDSDYGHGCVCPCHGDYDPAWCATCKVFVDQVDSVDY
jgi:hypothetical protein